MSVTLRSGWSCLLQQKACSNANITYTVTLQMSSIRYEKLENKNIKVVVYGICMLGKNYSKLLFSKMNIFYVCYFELLKVLLCIHTYSHSYIHIFLSASPWDGYNTHARVIKRYRNISDSEICISTLQKTKWNCS